MDPEWAQTEPPPSRLRGRLLGFIKILIGITIIVWRYSVKPGDLVKCGSCVLGILLRKLQYEIDDDEAQNWDGESAWWIQFVNDDGPTWSYEEELHLVGKRN